MSERWNGIVVNCAVVKLRSTPELVDDNIVGYAFLNRVFPILEELENFYKVSCEGNECYVLKDPKEIKKY